MRPDAQLLLFDLDAPPVHPSATIPGQFRRNARWWAAGLLPPGSRHWSNGCANPEARATATKAAAITTHAPMWRPEVDR